MTKVLDAGWLRGVHFLSIAQNEFQGKQIMTEIYFNKRNFSRAIKGKVQDKIRKKLQNFSLKRKCSVAIENCLSQEPGKVLQKLFKR